MEQKLENKICIAIWDQAFKIHTELGSGLLESVYEKCLQFEMKQVGFEAPKRRDTSNSE